MQAIQNAPAKRRGARLGAIIAAPAQKNPVNEREPAKVLRGSKSPLKASSDPVWEFQKRDPSRFDQARATSGADAAPAKAKSKRARAKQTMLVSGAKGN